MKVITTVVGSLQTNCYLLIDEETKSAALIDPGDEAEKLLALVKSEGVTLKYILLTHGHRDHTLAVPALKKALPDVPVYIGEADAHSTGIYHYPMTELVPDSTDAAQEKHVPVVTVEGSMVDVKVGSAPHPMIPEHYIQWVALETTEGCQIKYLEPGQAPEVKFALAPGDRVKAAYAYCNLHGLWRA